MPWLTMSGILTLEIALVDKSMNILSVEMEEEGLHKTQGIVILLGSGLMMDFQELHT